MGAAASLVERAWRVRRGRDDLLVLTRAEVAEDEACLAAPVSYTHLTLPTIYSV